RTLLKVGEFLFETGKTLFAETDLGKLLPLAMDKVIKQAEAQSGMIILYGPEGELLFQVARNQHQKNIEQPAEEISTTIVQQVRESGQSYVNKNALEDPSLDKSQSIHRIGILSVAAAPLRHEDKLLGVIYIDNRDVRAIFTDETGELLTEFAKLISAAVKKALEFRRLEAESAELRRQIDRRHLLEEMVAKSKGYDELKGLKSLAMLEACKRIENVAGTESPVLILGETGTGKELVARVLHKKSKRQKQAFLPLNCAAFVNPELLISELFGHIKGAFTGAINDKPGYFETAAGGTIFLDEITKSSSRFQMMLLRVLETGEFNRLGDTVIRHADVRILSAVNPNFQQLIEKGEFLQDLYFRLAKFTIQIPPLRERREDIMEIADYFLQKYSQEHERTIKAFDEKARELLLAYSWPGNVRELQNAVNEAVISADGGTIHAKDLPPALQSAAPGGVTAEEFNYRQATKKFELEFFTALLQKTNGNIAAAARLAGMDRSNLRRKLLELGINARDFEK
ncbi:sigma 54-interacting transcriptional regulator, partial [candidate division KSB1 bacterium]|nr:sigma 54-interacting transcriptional regulator [candidate division KSB1 bacterium]